MSPLRAEVPTRVVASSEQTLDSVVPGNGEELTDGPTEVVLTFVQDVPADATAVVSAPDGEVADPAVLVEGREMVVSVPDAGPGTYEVQYTLGGLTGSTGYTVLEPGQAPALEPAGSAGVLLSVLVGVALVAVMAMTVRRWRRS